MIPLISRGKKNPAIVRLKVIVKVTVNVAIFAEGKFRKNVGKTFHVGVIFTILLLFPSWRHMDFIFV